MSRAPTYPRPEKHARHQVMIQVPEDWAGNFKIADDVRYKDTRFCELSILHLHDGQWRVCIWGNDDTGMDRDFPADKFEEAHALFLHVAVTHLPKKKLFKELGFTWA